MKNKKMNNKGFSLVELIIVIAIMAVLVGILAPQYLKYVQRSKVSTDITNAEEIATAINVAISDGAKFGNGASDINITSGSAIPAAQTINNLDGFTVMPTSRVNSTYQWVITFDTTNGVSSITLGEDQIYPDASAYHAAND